MENIKVMPDDEKYAIVMDNIKFAKALTSTFIKGHLGDQAVSELEKIWQEGIKPILEEASPGEKYEIAYGNWIWVGKCDFNLIRKHLGKEGIAQYERDEATALKRKNASPSLYLLNLIRAISPQTAFKMTVKEYAYQLQWISPFSASEISSQKTVFDIPRCKILDYPETEDICNIGCQSVYPRWVAEQFKVKMDFDRQGHSCTCILTPLN